MRLATLVTNTDDSDFAHAWPLDDAKFANMIHAVRPGWQVDAFWVCKNAFPADLSAYDGIMITGSPASVHDADAWIDRLDTLLKDLITQEKPLFGACFGHQAIAKALGSEIIRNPQGWGHGSLPVTDLATGDTFHLYGSHIEQVAALPPGAVRTHEGPGVPVAGFALGAHVMTIQHHPEMEPDFMAALVEEYAAYMGPDITDRARASLRAPADSAMFAEQIARFFEKANR